MSKVFLDSSYAIALSNSNDQYNKQAGILSEKLKRENISIVTTVAVVIEIANALTKLRYRKASVELLNSLRNDPNVEIIYFSEELYKQAMKLYCDRMDKEWSLTDCISFVVMWSEKITEVLTADEHFNQAGFRVLL